MTDVKHRIAGGRDRVKGPIEDLLKARAEIAAPLDRGLTTGEITKALDLDKTRNGDVSAALHKIRNEGKVIVTTGPASSSKGRRFVKRYRWKKVASKPQLPDPPSDDRRFLSLCR